MTARLRERATRLHGAERTHGSGTHHGRPYLRQGRVVGVQFSHSVSSIKTWIASATLTLENESLRQKSRIRRSHDIIDKQVRWHINGPSQKSGATGGGSNGLRRIMIG
jgi:hypothetical protein